MADGCHFENRYNVYSSAANRPNMTKFGTRTQILTKATETWEDFRNCQIQDGGRTPHWISFLAITRLHIVRLRRSLEFGGIIARIRRLRCWKCPISKIQHGGRQSFWKSLYLHISAANRPNLTKSGRQTQILTKATKTW